MIYILYRYKIEPKKSLIGCFPLFVGIERLLLLKSINTKLITTITRTSTIGIMIGANDLKKKKEKKQPRL